MVMGIQEIKQAVRELPKAEQADLMHLLIELLVADAGELSAKWKTELDRREEALATGASIGKPAGEVIAKYTSH